MSKVSNELIDMLTLQIATGALYDLQLPDLEERLKESADKLLSTQTQEMQDDPQNKRLLAAIVERLVNMKED